jgi:hypothetical protein
MRETDIKEVNKAHWVADRNNLNKLLDQARKEYHICC